MTGTLDHSVEQIEIDVATLQSRGWASCVITPTGESTLGQRVLALACLLGTPISTRSGGDLWDTLVPTEAQAAKPRSLSRIHSVGEFPLHIDTAHWLTPCRYVILACVSPGSGGRPTLLLDTQQCRLAERHVSFLHSTPLRVTNGRNSFFSTILSKARSFLRFDPGCMTATTPEGADALDIFSHQHWLDHIEEIQWEKDRIVVIDNWRLLHGRGRTDGVDSDRILLRLSIR